MSNGRGGWLLPSSVVAKSTRRQVVRDDIDDFVERKERRRRKRQATYTIRELHSNHRTTNRTRVIG